MATTRENTTTDAVLAEVRRIKEELARAYGFDASKMLEDARKRQQLGGRKIVHPPARSTQAKR